MSSKNEPYIDSASDIQKKQAGDDPSATKPDEFEQQDEASESTLAMGSASELESLGEEDIAGVKLQEAQAQIEELTQQYLLARAEAENIRKRADVEIGNIRKFALENFVRELLSVKDSLDLARSIDLKSSTDDLGVVAKVVEGLELTVKQLESVFDRFEIREVSPALGDRLDPEFHQAMTIEETTDVEPSHICKVIQKGYLLHTRLLRPAMVVVAKAPEDS